MHSISSLSYRVKIPILGYKTTVVVILVLLFQTKGTCVVMVSLRGLFLEETTFLPEYIHFSLSIYTLVVKNIKDVTIHKCSEGNESEIFKVTDNKVVTHLLVNFSFIVIVVDPRLPSWDTPHFMIFILWVNSAIDSQYKTDAATDHYL